MRFELKIKNLFRSFNISHDASQQFLDEKPEVDNQDSVSSIGSTQDLRRPSLLPSCKMVTFGKEDVLFYSAC